MNAPLSTFLGYLKQMRACDLGETERSGLDTAFPGFKHKSDRQLEEERQRYADMGVTYVARTPFGPRRYSPILPELPRSRYSAIASDAVGDDGGAMMRELLAYHDWNHAGAINVFDCCTLEAEELGEWRFLYKGKMNALGVVLLSKQGTSDPYAHLGEVEGVIGGVVGRVFYLPYTVTQVTVPDVLDLRLLSSQEWFSQYFADRRNFKVIGSGSAPLQTKSFIEMIPTLMDPRLGGTDVTTFVGQWLIKNGANGLIYPSARSNAEVWFTEGKVESAFGWCFVDFRGLERDVITDTVFVGQDLWDLTERSAFDIRLVLGGKNTGSWWVQGPQQYLEKRLSDAHQGLTHAG